MTDESPGPTWQGRLHKRTYHSLTAILLAGFLVGYGAGRGGEWMVLIFPAVAIMGFAVWWAPSLGTIAKQLEAYDVR